MAYGLMRLHGFSLQALSTDHKPPKFDALLHASRLYFNIYTQVAVLRLGVTFIFL